MGRGFAGLRSARGLALSHVAGNCSWFAQFLKRADGKQAMLQSFVEWFNAVELDMRKAKETQAELLLRSEELRDALWGICDSKHEESEAARLKLAGDGSAAEHIGLLGLHLTSLAQVELDRFLATAQFLYSYCHYAQGIYNPPGAHKPLCPLPTVLSAAATEAAGKQDPPAKPGSAAAAPPPAYLQLQQLAEALGQAAPAGFLATADAVELMLRMASQGVLPPSWLDIDAAHMAAALSSFDPTLSGYLDWRELLLALAACSLPAIHTATPAQVAAQAAQLAAADGDADGCLTQAEFEGVRWWFEPGAEAVQAAQEEQQAAVVNETAAGQGGEGEAGAGSSAAQDVLREASR
ncbi:hypothetical protein OEZ86_006045 [Tetradesmus obliquus]|nr:hypothetical protein OEZ86_006045 [Tetradesmus obliquus]